MFTTPYFRAVAGASIAAGILALVSPASAQTHRIERVEGRRLEGNAYSRLRRLTAQQCEARCLADSKCTAFQYYQGGAPGIRFSANCALFSVVRSTKVSQYFLVGYKRTITAKRAAGPTVQQRARPRREQAEKATPPVARSVNPPSRAVVPPPATRGIGAAPAPSTDVGTRNFSPAVPVQAEQFKRVPIFYGTDRNSKTSGGRLIYGAERARRLELGYAVISVPLAHSSGNIERPTAWDVPIFGRIWQGAEDRSKHFTVLSIKAVSLEQFKAEAAKRLGASRTFRKQAIVFIHGYNVGFDDALYRTAQISYDLQFDGASFTYSWPSGTGWTSYPYDRESAAQAEPHLEKFLRIVQEQTGAESVNIIAHSMGNQLLLRVLNQLRIRREAPTNGTPVARINQIVLAAPDVDRDGFVNLTRNIRRLASRYTLYAASNDRALEASRIFAGNEPRAGDVPNPPLGPVVVEGIDTIDITKISTSYIALNHSGFADHDQLLTDLSLLFRRGEAPNLRLSSYRPVVGADGLRFWRYGN